MHNRRINSVISAAAVLLLMLMSFAGVTYSAHTGMTAFADYEFEFIDEDDMTADNDTDGSESDLIEFSTSENDHNSISYQEADVRGASFDLIKAFIISLIIGLVVAFIAVSIMKSGMKSVYMKQGASEYKKDNGFKLDIKDDTLLGKRVEKSPVMRAENRPPQGGRKP